MKSLITALLMTTLLAPLLSAQEGEKEVPKWGWQKEATASINLTQSSFDNYVQGGENSSAWQARISIKFENDQEKWNWSNTGKFEYGRNKTGEQESQKSVDEIKIESVYSLKTWKSLSPFISAVGETQFDAAYDYAQVPKAQVSAFLDPGYFREAIGLSYSRGDLLKARLGAALKQTVTSQFTSFTDDPATMEVEKIRNEVGAEGVIDLNYKISATTLLKSKVELFSNLKAFDQVDVIWDSDLTSKITKFIAFSFNIKLVYDKDISARRQLKQVMGIGLSYSFF